MLLQPLQKFTLRISFRFRLFLFGITRVTKRSIFIHSLITISIHYCVFVIDISFLFDTLVRRIKDFQFLFFFFFFKFHRIKIRSIFVRPISFRSISPISFIHRKLKTSRQYLYYIGIELSYERDQYPGFQ